MPGSQAAVASFPSTTTIHPPIIMTTLASTPWQESISLSIDSRNASESTYADIINQCACFSHCFLSRPERRPSLVSNRVHSLTRAIACSPSIQIGDLPSRRSSSRSATRLFSARQRASGASRVGLALAVVEAAKSEISEGGRGRALSPPTLTRAPETRAPLINLLATATETPSSKPTLLPSKRRSTV